MAWTAPTVEQLKGRFSPVELASLQRAKADLDETVLGEVLAQTVDYARGFVKARGRGTGAAGTLPPELVRPVLDIALVAYSASIGGVLLDQKGVRKAAADRAEELLRDVAAGRFAVEDATDATVSAHPGPAVETVDTVLEDDPIPDEDDEDDA